jgi:hypothetical protein
MLQTTKKLGLAAAACTLLGMASAQAAVTLTFAQTGANLVVATWSGSYDLPAADHTDTFSPEIVYVTQGLGAYGVGASGNYSATDFTGTSTFVGNLAESGTYSGDSFGFSDGTLYLPVGATGVFSPAGIMVFASNLANLGVDSFNNTLVFEGTGNVAGSRQIFFHIAGASAVPEPAGAATALICCVSGLLIRTRQRRRL